MPSFLIQEFMGTCFGSSVLCPKQAVPNVRVSGVDSPEEVIEEVEAEDPDADSNRMSEEEVKIEEVNFEFRTMHSLNKGKKQSHSFEKLKRGSTSLDVVEFSSLREQNHEMFTSDAKVRLGKVRIENGCIYEGEWVRGAMSGFGVLTWPNGAKYEVVNGEQGFWENSQAKGRGKLTFQDGVFYDGEWRDDKANGYGEYRFKDGSIYRGNWRDDRQSGHGVQEWADLTRYEGDFFDGLKHGRGAMTFPGVGQFDGEFDMGVISGKGTFHFKNGRVYSGCWKHNKMDGFGIMRFPNKKEYAGEFKAGQRSGTGKLSWPDGRRYEGEWKNDKQHGDGKFFFSTGTVKFGIWEVGQLVRWTEPPSGNNLVSAPDSTLKKSKETDTRISYSFPPEAAAAQDRDKANIDSPVSRK